MCNDEDASEHIDYFPNDGIRIIKSHYQNIRFFHHPETKDQCLKLDDTVQQCASYRPHYHEFAVHFPARFIETTRRVLFVGRGDSMVLHEVLKCKCFVLSFSLSLYAYMYEYACVF